PYYTPPSPDALPLATFKNYSAVLTQPSFHAAMRNTLVVGAASAAALVLLTALASSVVVKGRVRGRALRAPRGAVPRGAPRNVLPLLAPVLLASWVFVFLLSTKELGMSVLLTSPRTQVMSVAFFELWNNGQVTEVAAFGVLWAIALALVTGVLFLLGRRYGLQ